MPLISFICTTFRVHICCLHLLWLYMYLNLKLTYDALVDPLSSLTGTIFSRFDEVVREG